MKALFLGNVAVDTFEGIQAELPAGLATVILPDPQQLTRSPEAAADADILVSNHWRADYPPAPKVRLVQSVATGVELFDLLGREPVDVDKIAVRRVPSLAPVSRVRAEEALGVQRRPDRLQVAAGQPPRRLVIAHFSGGFAARPRLPGSRSACRGSRGARPCASPARS